MTKQKNLGEKYFCNAYSVVQHIYVQKGAGATSVVFNSFLVKNECIYFSSSLKLAKFFEFPQIGLTSFLVCSKNILLSKNPHKRFISANKLHIKIHDGKISKIEILIFLLKKPIISTHLFSGLNYSTS